MILKLAIAYDGYKFDLPAFLDFRGRIYRSGVLHFHERDLARSLILFADSNKESVLDDNIKRALCSATAFHYKSFISIHEAEDWFYRNISEDIYQQVVFARDAKRPFQYLANLFGINAHKFNCIPIVQDASASAYQIMS